MSHPINHICSVCENVYTNPFEVLQCFFSHQEPEGYEDTHPEDYIEMVTRLCLEKIPVPDLIDISFDNLVKLAKAVNEVREAKEATDLQPLTEKLAAAVVSVRTLCFMFCEIDEMNILIEQYARELKEKHSL